LTICSMLTSARAGPTASSDPITVATRNTVRIMVAESRFICRKVERAFAPLFLSFRAESRNGASLGSCDIDGKAGGRASGSERVNLRLISSYLTRGLEKVAHLITHCRLAVFGRI